MKIYIAGKITGEDENAVFNKFASAKVRLENSGELVMSPHVLLEDRGFEHGDYMHICYAMIDVCDAIFVLKDWQKSKGARMELQYACDHQKRIFYEDNRTQEDGFPIQYGHPARKAGYAE